MTLSEMMDMPYKDLMEIRVARNERLLKQSQELEGENRNLEREMKNA